MFTLAGGLTNTAYGGKVLIEEILDRNSRRVDEVALNAAGLARPMHDGDLVNVVPLSPKFENAVTLRGNVASPGRYPWREGMRVSDLIPSREFLVTREYWKQQNQVTLESQVAWCPTLGRAERCAAERARHQLGLRRGAAHGSRRIYRRG